MNMSWMNTAAFLTFIKWVALIQVGIALLLILTAYGVKLYIRYRDAYLKTITQRLRIWILDAFLNQKTFDVRLMPYQRFTVTLIHLISALDKELAWIDWSTVRNQIMDKIVLPKVHQFVHARSWTKRFYACIAFEHLTHHPEESVVIQLLNDGIPLVTIHASIVALMNPSQRLVDEVINVFSKSRRVQQDLYTRVISETKHDIVPFVQDRLLREDNPYVKSFCYRILTALPKVSHHGMSEVQDFNDSNIDLKLSVLSFWIKHFPAKMIDKCLQCVKDTRWEVRARAVKLLGELRDPQYAVAVGACLRDSSWWVRINAATALLAFGERGMTILKKQDPSIDRFAYDAANQVLVTLQKE